MAKLKGLTGEKHPCQNELVLAQGRLVVRESKPPAFHFFPQSIRDQQPPELDPGIKLATSQFTKLNPASCHHCDPGGKRKIGTGYTN
jgi:hypothetical protein